MFKWSLVLAMGVMVGCGSNGGDSNGDDGNGGTSQNEAGGAGSGGHASESGGTASGGESGSGGTTPGGAGGSDSGGTSTGGTSAGGAQSFATTADENCKLVDISVSACPENAVYGWGDCLNKPSDDCFASPNNLAWCCPNKACSRSPGGSDMGLDTACDGFVAGTKSWICQTDTPGTENCTAYVGGIYCCPE